MRLVTYSSRSETCIGALISRGMQNYILDLNRTEFHFCQMTMEDVKSKTKPVKRARKPVLKKAERQRSAPAKRAQPRNGLSQPRKRS